MANERLNNYRKTKIIKETYEFCPFEKIRDNRDMFARWKSFCYTKERCLIVLARGRSTHREISLYCFENGDKPCVIFNVVREQLCTNKGLEIMERMVYTDPRFFSGKSTTIVGMIDI